tara:strand:+ start:490 stop:984 length:495 start_codon:yes stop_codon:yes gene_type:complete
MRHDQKVDLVPQFEGSDELNMAIDHCPSASSMRSASIELMQQEEFFLLAYLTQDESLDYSLQAQVEVMLRQAWKTYKLDQFANKMQELATKASDGYEMDYYHRIYEAAMKVFELEAYQLFVRRSKAFDNDESDGAVKVRSVSESIDKQVALVRDAMSKEEQVKD